MTADLYLDLMKRCLVDFIYGPVEDRPCIPIYDSPTLICHKGYPELSHPDGVYCDVCRTGGVDVPSYAHTMIGVPRLNNIQSCVEQVLVDNIPGDLCETGIWRGGAVIFMRAILKAYGVTDRKIWAADSFCGFPEHSDAGFSDDTHKPKDYVVTLEQVRKNFDRYGLKDDITQFLVGWFKDTLPRAPIEKLSVLRLDGDLYESTMDALNALYPKLSVGGYLIVDDIRILPGCNDAVHQYWDEHKLDFQIIPIDDCSSFWRKTHS